VNFHESRDYSFADAAMAAMQAEIKRLQRWKADANAVLNMWEQAFERADITGMLGARKPDLMVAEIERLRAAIAATWSTEMQSRLDAHCAYSDAYDQTLHNRPDPPDPGRGSD
jgi:hypothetical protein